MNEQLEAECRTVLHHVTKADVSQLMVIFGRPMPSSDNARIQWEIPEWLELLDRTVRDRPQPRRRRRL